MNLASVAADARCAHCDLPVPAGLFEPDASEQFCCNGCSTVYRAIHELGLERFYDILEPDDLGVRGTATEGSYEAYDHETFNEHYVRRTANGNASVELYLEGLHCAACVWLVEKLPRVMAGLTEARVDLGKQLVRVTWDPERIRLSAIARRMDSLGYPSRPYRAMKLRDLRRAEDRKMLIRLAVSGAIAGNVMLISFALFGGMFAPMQSDHRALFRWSSLVLGAVALLWPGRVFLVGAVASLRTRTAHMDLPVAIALTAGTLWGAANVIRDTGETYFESLTAVIFLLLFGRYILQRRQREAQDSVELLYSVTPQTARRIEHDAVREVPIEALSAGERVEVRPGDSVPADGVVVSGRSDFDLALLTGESRPVPVVEGGRVWAGTVNLSERIVVEVAATGAATRVGKLMTLVERCSRERPSVVRLADRVAHGFVLVVLGLALGTAFAWWSVDPERAMENTIAFLIVTCPCALGLATPLAIVAAIGHAARRGILIKGGRALESLARPGRMLLDKTGTLTEGRLKMSGWHGDRSVRPLVAAVERTLTHPIARAFTEALADETIPGGRTEVRQTQEGGVEARVGDAVLLIGSPAFVLARTGEPADWVPAAIEETTSAGSTPVAIARNDEVVAVAGFDDPLWPNARADLLKLAQGGWSVGVLSGDHPEVTRRIAARAGIEPDHVAGSVSPEQKAERVITAVREGKTVVMVGDGVNDTAALSAATVGVAVHGGAEASLSSSDVYLGRPGLKPLVELTEGAQRTLGVIRRNIAVSLAYNLIAGSLAIAGLINPLIAAILMPISSLTVVTLSYRSRTFRER